MAHASIMTIPGIRHLHAGVRRFIQSVVVLLMLLGTQFAFAATPAPDVAAKFPATLVVGTLAGGWAPFEEVVDGRLTGLSADYLRALVGPDVVIEPATFPDMPQLLAAVAAGRVDLLMSVARTPEREHTLSFTAPYFRASTSVVVKADNHAVSGPAQLVNGRLAIETGFALERSLRERFPRAEIVLFADTGSALRAVAQGDADAYLGFTPAVQHALSNEAFRGLRIAFENTAKPSELRFAVSRDRGALRDRLDRALAAMYSTDETAIRARWLDASLNSPTLQSTNRQQRAVPPAEKPRIGQKPVTGTPGEGGAWSVTAIRLLPLLIAACVVLAVTLRAYLLLQREVRLRKQTEWELAAQLNFQQTMMETVPYPLVAKDLEGRYIAINRAYEECSGLWREQVMGLTSEEVQAWGRENSRKLESATREMLKTGERVQLELEFVDANGEGRHGLFWTRLCHGVDGKPSCVMGTMVDITDIRRAEMLARENERRLFDVTRSLPAVVFQLRRDSHGRYSFPYIGGDAQHLLGGISSAFTGHGAIDFERIWEEDRPRVLSELERSARMETPIHLEFRFLATEGLKWVRAELVPRRESAGSVVWSGYWVDASAEHARAEELARARDVAEAASRAKDDFLAMMSHEIRTPMNGVLGLVEVLERTRLNADQGEMLGMIHESAGALLQILDDLLDYSKIEAGRLAIEAEPIDLRELVDNAVGLLAGRAHEKGLKVRVDIEPEVAASLRGDSVRLRQILFNLFGNAIKFTAAGEVNVRVAVAEQSHATQTLEMTVEDTGIGIAPDVQARLFEPFVQAESSTTRRFGGTGLGLTICRKLIALMGGVLELQSTPGIGTRMTVRLAMPIETRSYQVSGLRGKRGVVAVADAHVAQALVHFGQALGIEFRRVGLGTAEWSDPAVLADADLIFLSEGIEIPCAARLRSRVICLTEKPKPTGYRILEDVVRVSINPISWRGLGAACAAALTGLPAHPPRSRILAEAGSAPPDRERAIASGRLILVAEDHPVNQELIRHQLTLLGFACDVVNDGAEALAALQQTSYGCLITDCHMPNLSGYELTRRVREVATQPASTPRLPILGITANTAPEDLSQCRDAGMDNCLVKPTRLSTLREHLSHWFGADGTRQAAMSTEPISAVPAAEAHGLESVTAFVPVDLDHMTQLWGSESTVKALLDSFVTSVRDDVRALPPLLDDANVAQLRDWHHRVAGAVGVLQYPPLLAVLEQYRAGMTVKTPDALRADGLALARKCHAMLDGIEEQAALLA
ncbi:two-component system sensor histidine kinase EvgS [Paraburkholderia sp. GAS41]|uniref:ATP-binding protein n=1 Tax=Paraburkholderia sp. GAS41 TaxID=3035134 RepID=UPI003D1F2E94